LKNKMQVVFLLSISACLFVNYIHATKDPNSTPNRNTAVHLFEWKWTDIANECEQFLGPHGYSGVQVSPPNDHALIDGFPWYQRYQPVSYQLQSRSGTEAEFIDMVNRCNNAGVRIYVDAVINHMAAGGNRGSAGTSYNPVSENFPGVPYSPLDFGDSICKSASGGIENYNDLEQVRNCRLVGLPDLVLSKDYVSDKIAEYMNRLISIGVAGFRIDAAKHMWPNDLNKLISKLNNLPSSIFGDNKQPFIYFEVIDLGGEPIKNTDYTWIGRVSEFRYGKFLSEVVRKQFGQKLTYLNNFGMGWGMIPDGDAQIMIDNHDNQRGHGAGGDVLTFFDSRLYKIATAFMLAWPYGYPVIMSSYNFNRNDNSQGPPSDSNGNTNSVVINADQSCGGGWICEHRWRQISNMARFRNTAEFQSVQNWWDNGNNQIAFSRGNKAFIAINNDDYGLDQWLQTGLPQGQYCDVISGNLEQGHCTGKIITVQDDGRAQITVANSEEDPMIAIHVDAKL
jgi:alpha-amylase